MEETTTELEEKEYSATAGGGAVKATVTGKMEVKSLEIDPEVVDPEDVEMLSDIVIGAVNEALEMLQKKRKMHYLLFPVVLAFRVCSNGKL